MPREAWVLVKAMVSDVYPDNSLPGPQPPFPPTGGGGGLHPGWPTVPGWPGGSLPGGGAGFPGGPPYPDNTLPGQQPGIWGPTDPRPTPPIYIPIMPPAGADGAHPEHPIYIPVYPSHPIMLPGMPGWDENQKAQVIKAVLDMVKFWTGNLPPTGGTEPKPTPV